MGKSLALLAAAFVLGGFLEAAVELTDNSTTHTDPFFNGTHRRVNLSEAVSEEDQSSRERPTEATAAETTSVTQTDKPLEEKDSEDDGDDRKTEDKKVPLGERTKGSISHGISCSVLVSDTKHNIPHEFLSDLVIL